MKSLYRISLIAYKTGLILAIAFFFPGNLFVMAAGHTCNIKPVDYLLIGFFFAITVIILTLYNRFGKARNVISTILFFVATGLVLFSIIFAVYDLFDTFFICKCFIKGDTEVSVIIFVFTGIAIIALTGVIKERKSLLEQK
ncbi:MAG: hypothetical protein IPP79_19215 [Chitinophagaceae bacterium]|nr:hypothetical protein [Chitinophagaceae bacterium]